MFYDPMWNNALYYFSRKSALHIWSIFQLFENKWVIKFERWQYLICVVKSSSDKEFEKFEGFRQDKEMRLVYKNIVSKYLL